MREGGVRKAFPRRDAYGYDAKRPLAGTLSKADGRGNLLPSVPLRGSGTIDPDERKILRRTLCERGAR